MKHIKLFEDFINESVISDAGYALNRLADNQVGGVPATEFQEEHNLDIDALTRAIVHTKEITRYELRDIIQGTAPKSKIKRFLKTYVMESVVNEAEKAKMDKISKTESNRKVLFGFDEFVNEKKKSKPKNDKQKIKDLVKKQKGLSKKSNDIKGDILDLSKGEDPQPTDKLQGLLLQTQMQQAQVDGQKASVQIQQISLKKKLKTAKAKEKALKDIDKDKKPATKDTNKQSKDKKDI
mgnify:CR=1 FL=1